MKICDIIDQWKSGNRVSDLYDAIRRHQMLWRFDLQGCMLGNDRVKKGLEMLRSVKSLDTLDLQDNGIDRACLPAIQEFLRASNVKHMYLQGNLLKKPDFGELEPFVAKLGRECTVYCYKDKEQPTRKLICSTVEQVVGADESLSYSTAHLNSIFKKYRDRVNFVQTAADDEIVYAQKSREVIQSGAASPTATCDTAAAAAEDVVMIADDTRDGQHYDGLPAADLVDSVLAPRPKSAVHSNTQPQPSLLSSALSSSAAAASSPIDMIVAMGFRQEAAAAAYAKSGQDVQVHCSTCLLTQHLSHTFLQRAVEILIKDAHASPPPLTAPLNKKISRFDRGSGVAGGSHKIAVATPVATIPRQRRIRDSDDDDDDIPVSRLVSDAALVMPQSKVAQVLPADDDEIVLLRLTQGTHPGTADSSDASLSIAPICALQSGHDASVEVIKDDDDGNSRQAEDDDAPMVHVAEGSHAAQRPAALDALSGAPVRASEPAVVRPKLKGLGSLVRRF